MPGAANAEGPGVTQVPAEGNVRRCEPSANSTMSVDAAHASATETKRVATASPAPATVRVPRVGGALAYRARR